MLTAPASPRLGTKRTLLRRANASRIGMLWMLITPNAVLTPHLSRKAAVTSPTVSLSGMAVRSSGDLECCARGVGGERRGEEQDRARRLFRIPEAAERNSALLGGVREPCLARDRTVGGGRRFVAALPLAGIDQAEQ